MDDLFDFNGDGKIDAFEEEMAFEDFMRTEREEEKIKHRMDDYNPNVDLFYDEFSDEDLDFTDEDDDFDFDAEEDDDYFDDDYENEDDFDF